MVVVGVYTSTYLDNMINFNVGHTAICVDELGREDASSESESVLCVVSYGERRRNGGSILLFQGTVKMGNVEKQDACVKFIKYMLSEPVQIKTRKIRVRFRLVR